MSRPGALASPPPRALRGGPRPVFCVIEGERRDREVAEEVAAGRFTLAGITCELGLEPDWIGAALPDDEEWRIEWSKFYYGLDLAHAFAVTGQRRPLDAWERLVGSWIDQVPVGLDVSDVAGRRLQNWLYAWQAFAAADAFDGLRDGLEEALRASIGAQAAWVREHLAPERNHRTLALYALLLVGLALPEHDGDGELTRFAVTELHRNLLEDFRPDGVHREASTHYHMIALRSFLGAIENARRFGLELPDGFLAHVGRACDFALHSVRPDGGIPALSDADGGRYDAMLELAATVLGREDLRYVASGGRAGTPPRERHASFPDGGYWIQRSGWGTGETAPGDERYLIFDCGPLGDGGHGHYDLLNLEIAAGGRPLVVDPGRYTYAEGEPNLRHWFKGTAAHNTVTVDGLDQTPYAPRRPKGPVATGRFLGRHSAPRLDILAGEATSPAYDAVHHRTVAFVADAYWIVLDRLHGRSPHRYYVRWHLGPDAEGHTALAPDDRQVTVRAPHVALAVASGPKVRLTDGWVSPRYGVKQRAPVVSAMAQGAEATCTTLVMPLDAVRPAPALTVETDGPTTVVAVEHEGASDLVAFASAPVRMALGPLHVTARAAWLRRGEDGSAVAMAACDATSLELTGSVDVALRRSRAVTWAAWRAGEGLRTGEDAT